jgi:hypothetical protein
VNSRKGLAKRSAGHRGGAAVAADLLLCVIASAPGPLHAGGRRRRRDGLAGYHRGIIDKFDSCPSKMSLIHSRFVSRRRHYAVVNTVGAVGGVEPGTAAVVVGSSIVR